MTQAQDYLQISVADDGRGLSLDTSLARFQKELGIRLTETGAEKVLSSEWYYNIQRAIGREQAERLIAWPYDPQLLRGVTVGTIFDLQFIVGFSESSWEIRSLTSGMGLWGVRYITEKLGGSVVGTNQFDKGALFTITLPNKNLV